ncbi:MAG: DUF6443 domain-containing protein [Bacteroidota bacterium]
MKIFINLNTPVLLFGCIALLMSFVPSGKTNKSDDRRRVGCTIQRSSTDSNTADQYTQVSYELTGGCSGTSTWSVSGATEVNHTNTTLTVYFGSSGTATISATMTGDQQPDDKIITVSEVDPLTGGTITSGKTQAINYNWQFATVSVSSPTHGNGTYQYMWFKSTTSATDMGSFISTGIDDEYLSPANLTVTTYFIRRVQSGPVDHKQTEYSDVATITVYPDINAGGVSPALDTVDYNTSSGTLTASGVSGGTGSGYTYQWQSSTNNSTWTNISGATGSTYSSGPITAAHIWFRYEVTNNGATKIGTPTLITIKYPDLVVGPITGGDITIPVNTATNGLFDDEISGGNGTYTYRWEISYDGSSWQYTPFHTPGYPAEVLSAKRYYRLGVTSNGIKAYSPSTLINVGVPLNALKPGTILTPSQTIESLMTAEPIEVTDASNGTPYYHDVTTPYYRYVWESSANGIDFTPTSDTLNNYPSKSFNATTYLRRRASDAAGRKAYTAVTQVTVELQGVDGNYIKTRTILTPGKLSRVDADTVSVVESVSQATQYYDGLGRPTQSVVWQGSPNKKDMITINVYDQYNRESYHYMPYTSDSSNGFFRLKPILNLTTFNQAQFDEQVVYGKTLYEYSPLSRPIAANAPGDSWVDHGTKTEYLFNLAGDSVQIWNADGILVGVYAPGQLIKTITTDEDLHVVVEFKDKDGKVVLKRVQYSQSGGLTNIWACTYYVYDDNENLVLVIPPEGVKKLINGN